MCSVPGSSASMLAGYSQAHAARFHAQRASATSARPGEIVLLRIGESLTQIAPAATVRESPIPHVARSSAVSCPGCGYRSRATVCPACGGAL